MVFPSWLAPYLFPPRVVSLSLPALGACCACGWVDVPSPPRTSRTLLTCLTGCQCGSSCSIQRWTHYGCGPVFLTFGLLRPLACAPAWWSIGPGWCLNLIPTPVNCSDLPDLTLDLLVLRYSSWGLSCFSSPLGVCIVYSVFVPS